MLSPEAFAQQRAEALEAELDRKFPDVSDYREAIETVSVHFQVVLDGLEADAKRREAKDHA